MVTMSRVRCVAPRVAPFWQRATAVGLTLASPQGTAPLGMAALLLHATAAVVLPQTWTRRSFVGSACAAAALPASAQASTMDLREALAVASPAQEAIFKRLPNPPRPPTPPAALLLRAEEVCHEQQELLRSASAADEKLILARAQTSLFVRILIRNTNLEQISGAQGAVSFIRGVASIAEAGLGPLTSEELLAMAKQYRAAEVRAEAPLVAGRGASWVHRGTARRPHSYLEHSKRRRSQPTAHTSPRHPASRVSSSPLARSLDRRMSCAWSSRPCPPTSRRRAARSRGSSGSRTTSGGQQRRARPRRLRGRRLSVSAGCMLHPSNLKHGDAR